MPPLPEGYVTKAQTRAILLQNRLSQTTLPPTFPISRPTLAQRESSSSFTEAEGGPETLQIMLKGKFPLPDVLAFNYVLQ